MTPDALPPPPSFTLAPVVRLALQEDLGSAGDITTEAVLPPGAQAEAVLRARQPGVVAGLAPAAAAFALCDAELRMLPLVQDGEAVGAGTPLLRVAGSCAAILAAERVAVNFLQHLSGIATAAREMTDAIAHTRARLLCTRKTTPGLRMLEKRAVRAGGGQNHRFGLHDAVLIKDNHLAMLGGDMSEAVRRARAHVGPMRMIELEVDTLAQLERALAADPPDVVLLDNMSPDSLRDAVCMAAGRVPLEASGGIRPDNVRAVAETGVDFLSSGWLTQSAPALDIGLDI